MHFDLVNSPFVMHGVLFYPWRFISAKIPFENKRDYT